MQRRELRNIGESLEVIPQALDQSNKEPLKAANNWSSKLSKSSKVLQFRSLQRHHIKHKGARFQMLDECFSISHSRLRGDCRASGPIVNSFYLQDAIWQLYNSFVY